MSEDKLQFAPVVEGLEEVKVVSGEEEEDTVYKVRARLFRYARENDPPMWKGESCSVPRVRVSRNLFWQVFELGVENCFVGPHQSSTERGIGEVRFLRHKESKKIRLLMRREKTLKLRCFLCVLAVV